MGGLKKRMSLASVGIRTTDCPSRSPSNILSSRGSYFWAKLKNKFGGPNLAKSWTGNADCAMEEFWLGISMAQNLMCEVLPMYELAT